VPLPRRSRQKPNNKEASENNWKECKGLQPFLWQDFLLVFKGKDSEIL
jgi:hypothetical protein